MQDFANSGIEYGEQDTFDNCKLEFVSMAENFFESRKS